MWKNFQSRPKCCFLSLVQNDEGHPECEPHHVLGMPVTPTLRKMFIIQVKMDGGKYEMTLENDPFSAVKRFETWTRAH